MRRSGLILVVVILLVLAAGAAFVFLNARQEDQAVESDVARVRPDAVGGSPIVDIGSGASLDRGWYQLYFTAPKYPDDPANHRGGLDERLVALMDGARNSLDVASYDFDLANVADAMVRAKGRGVRVRMVTDSDTLNKTKNREIQDAFAKLRGAGIPIVDDKRGPIMHHKFTVVDREWVETGSWNYTDGDTYRLNNHMIIIRSKELAANYSAEFDRMFERKQFGPNKDAAIPNPVVAIDGTSIQTYFAPQHNVGERIASAIGRSRQSVYFLAFSFTDDRIATAMLDRQAAGVTLGGVFETTGSNTEYSEYTEMKRRGLEVYQDGNPWVMHHKVIIIDERITILGSFNFSSNADTQNDENLLMIDNPELARAFKAEYDRILALAKNPPPKKKGARPRPAPGGTAGERIVRHAVASDAVAPRPAEVRAGEIVAQAWG